MSTGIASPGTPSAGQEPFVRWTEVEELLSMVQCAFQFKSRAIENFVREKEELLDKLEEAQRGMRAAHLNADQLSQTLEATNREKQYYLQQTDALEAEVCSQSERCELLEEALESLQDKFDQLEARVGQIGGRLMHSPLAHESSPSSVCSTQSTAPSRQEANQESAEREATPSKAKINLSNKLQEEGARGSQRIVADASGRSIGSTSEKDLYPRSIRIRGQSPNPKARTGSGAAKRSIEQPDKCKLGEEEGIRHSLDTRQANSPNRRSSEVVS